MEKQTSKSIVKKAIEKKSRNRPFFTPFGKYSHQSVSGYKTDNDLYIRDRNESVVSVSLDEIDSLILALLSTRAKLLSH